jgi:two-component system heavy metal sensor histidine kinase CusS
MPSLEEALLVALEDERQLSEERALLPGLLQHDLANVLCQVSLSASVLTTTASESERANCVRDVLGGVKRMNELLLGMKFLFLTRAGAADFQRGDLADFVAALVRAPGAWPVGSPVALELPSTAVCSFSPTLLRHALVNLIGNAVVYSRNTWVRVRLARIRGTRWQLAVANGGPGIPANHLPYLFDLAPTANFSSRSAGAGLGLYLARMCLRLHGSQLRLRTREGLTVFSFPVLDAQHEGSAAELGARGGFAA